MTINVQLQYHTNWGESVQLRIGKRRIPMEYSFGGLWQIMLTGRDLHHGDEFTYEVVRDGKVVQREWRTHHFKAPQPAGPEKHCGAFPLDVPPVQFGLLCIGLQRRYLPPPFRHVVP